MDSISVEKLIEEKLFEEKLFENLWLDWLDSRNNFEHLRTLFFLGGQSLWNHGLTSQVWCFPVFSKNMGIDIIAKYVP